MIYTNLIKPQDNSINKYRKVLITILTGSRRASRVLALLIAGLLVISLQTGYRAGWIAAKAGFSQVLLEFAWEQSKALQRPIKPWPWMDTHPVARLSVDKGDETHIVLDGASGEAMAFGPSHIRLPFDQVQTGSPGLSGEPGALSFETTATSAKAGLVAIGGHRDTHLRFLQHMSTGDTVSLETADGRIRHYSLESAQIVDTDQQDFLIEPTTPGLLLVTCYPFDSLSAGGPLRLVAFARDITASHQDTLQAAN